jgi:mono/diheme cytochrome c family protein
VRHSRNNAADPAASTLRNVVVNEHEPEQRRRAIMRRDIGALIGMLVVSGVVSAQTPDPKQVAAGKDLFVTMKCGTCHRAEGKGPAKLTLDGISAKMPTAQIRAWIASPAEMEAKLSKPPTVKMSTMMKKKLPDADVDALVAYVLSLK